MVQQYSPLRNDWSRAYSPASDWSHMAMDPLTAGPSSWAAGTQSPMLYGQRRSAGADYDPSYGSFGMYDPASTFTTQIINEDIQRWLQQEYPHLYDFDTGAINPGGPTQPGDVAQDPSFGQFHQDPRVYTEIQAAANKYGVPANLIMAMIGRESSGHWGSGVGSNGPYDNTKLTWLGSRGHWIAGYTGITQPAAEAWGYDIHAIGSNRALQIDAMANGLNRLYQAYGGQYGWDGVIAAYYSGDPSGRVTPSDSHQYGTTGSYANDVKTWWNALDAWNIANGRNPSRTGQAGMTSPNSPAWQPINKFDQFVTSAASRYGVPANLIKAVMRMENPDGDPQARHPSSGATGLMQIMPGIWNEGNWQQLQDPAYNINKGAEILKIYYNQFGTWENAAKAYLAGTPGSTAVDANETGVHQYWAKVNAYWNELDAAASGAFGAEPQGGQGPVTSVSAIWGGQQFNITQEHGRTAFSATNPDGMYNYSYGVLGFLGHPGIDVGMPVGTSLYSPVGGTVVTSGGTGYYLNVLGQNPNQQGELKIRLDNGHEIILGHMAGIYVTAGQRVNPGQLVGVSGYPSAPHLHLEYRIPNSRMSSGWEAIDPRLALQGLFGGSLSGPTAQAGINRPMTYDEMLRAAAQGQPVDYGMPMSSGSSWNQWMQSAMTGNIPSSGTTGSMVGWGATPDDPFANLRSFHIAR